VSDDRDVPWILLQRHGDLAQALLRLGKEDALAGHEQHAPGERQHEPAIGRLRFEAGELFEGGVSRSAFALRVGLRSLERLLRQVELLGRRE
jgi:hypothetical protein